MIVCLNYAAGPSSKYAVPVPFAKKRSPVSLSALTEEEWYFTDDRNNENNTTTTIIIVSPVDNAAVADILTAIYVHLSLLSLT